MPTHRALVSDASLRAFVFVFAQCQNRVDIRFSSQTILKTVLFDQLLVRMCQAFAIRSVFRRKLPNV